MTQEKLTQTNCPISTLFAEDSLAKAFQSLENEKDSAIPEELSSLKLPELPPSKNLNICCLRMFPDCYRMTAATILGTLDELGYDVEWQVLNSANFGVAQSRKRVFIVGFHREKCSGKVLSFTDANPKTLVQRIPGKEGKRVYSVEGLSITLTSQAGGFGGKTGLYEILGLPIKVKTKTGYQIALPGDSIDLAYPDMNSRRGRVGKEIAHTLTTNCNQGYYAMCIDMNPDPKVTELARCITSRQDSGIGHHKVEKSGVILVTEPIAVLTPAKEAVRQQGRRFMLPDEPMFTITVTDRHGVVYCGYIRKLMPGFVNIT